MALPEHFLGEIVMFGGNYAPDGWAFCDGQLLDIMQYQALFSVIGDRYGGNGTTNFALPNLKARFPLHRGDVYPQGSYGGTTQTQISVNNLPAHNHKVMASSDNATLGDPTNNILATSRYNVYGEANNIIEMNASSTETVGGGQPFNNMPPFLSINFIICLEGLYPSRS